jgi:hypothetical protein
MLLDIFAILQYIKITDCTKTTWDRQDIASNLLAFIAMIYWDEAFVIEFVPFRNTLNWNLEW